MMTGEVPQTRWSMVAAAGTDTPAGRAALAWLCEHYWQPLRAHARRRGFRDDEDQVQGFLATLIERGSLVEADRDRGRFRSWMLACLDHFLANQVRHRQAMKRGSGRPDEVLDEAQVEAPAEADPAGAFDRDWALTLLAHAMQRLAAEQTGTEASQRFAALQVFLSANGDGAAYAAVGTRLGMTETAVKVAVHRLRQRLRELVRTEVAETLAVEDERAIDAELDVFLAALRHGV